MVDSRFYESKGPFSISEILKITGCVVNEDSNKDLLSKKFSGVAPLNLAGSTEVSFLDNPKYIDSFSTSNAGACIVHEKHMRHAPAGMCLLFAENPYLAFAAITDAFYPGFTFTPGISEKADISKTAKIGKDCRIESGASLGENVIIGDNCFIGANTVINRGVKIGNNNYIASQVSLSFCEIGDNVIIHTGARIGQDGFGFATNAIGKHVKVPQVGRVMIHNNVEIGANTCIDRGSGPDTVIGEDTKIDNLVQIGHNVQIGKGCIIVSQVGISGSTKLGDYVVLAGQVGLAGHLKLGNGSKIAAQSGVMHDIPPGKNYGGYPAVPIKQWHRQNVIIKNLLNKNQGNL